MNVNELRKSLLGRGIPEDEVEDIIEATLDDYDSDDGLDPDMIKSIADEIRDDLSDVGDDDGLDDFYDDDGDYDAEVDSDGEYIDVESTLGSVVKAANRNVELLKASVLASQDTDASLAKGLMAVGAMQEMTADGLYDLQQSVYSLNKSMGAIMQRLGVPVPPRAVSGEYDAIAHPGEAEIDDDEPRRVRKSNGLAKSNDVIRAIRSEQEKLQKSRDPQDTARLHSLSEATALLESGLNPGQIASDFNIDMG